LVVKVCNTRSDWMLKFVISIRFLVQAQAIYSHTIYTRPALIGC